MISMWKIVLGIGPSSRRFRRPDHTWNGLCRGGFLATIDRSGQQGTCAWANVSLVAWRRRERRIESPETLADPSRPPVALLRLVNRRPPDGDGGGVPVVGWSLSSSRPGGGDRPDWLAYRPGSSCSRRAKVH